jgi:hypothetical protein
MLNTEPIEIENVKVFTGDNFYDPADAYLNNLKTITGVVLG